MTLLTLVAASALLHVARPPPPAQPANEVSAADIERVAQAIEKAMPAGRRLEGLVTRRVWMSKPGEPAPDPAHDPPGMSDEHVVRLLGPGWAVVAPRPLVSVWVYAEGRRYARHLAETSAQVSNSAQDPSAIGLALLLQVDMFNPVEIGRPLAEAVRDSQPISLTMSGTTATYRFTDRAERKSIDTMVEKAEREGTAQWKSRPRPWPREVTVELGDAPRLLGWAIDIPRRGLDQPYVRDACTVEAWQQVGEDLLPSRIRRSTALRNDEPYVQITELSRVTPLPEPAAPDAVLHPLPEGLVVRDDARPFSFVVGSPEIEYEGRHLRLREPLWLHPGDALEELLHDAVEW